MEMIRTFDVNKIRSIVCAPEIWPYMGEGDLKKEEWETPIHDVIHWLCSDDNAAIVMFHPHYERVWEAHTAVLSGARHNTKNYHLKAIEYLKKNTNCLFLTCFIPKGNYPAMRAVEALGMKKQTVLPNVFKRRGKLIDITMYGMSI